MLAHQNEASLNESPMMVHFAADIFVQAHPLINNQQKQWIKRPTRGADHRKNGNRRSWHGFCYGKSEEY
jgi:hypothetical protein